MPSTATMNFPILHDTTFWLGVIAGWAMLAVGWGLVAVCMMLYHQADLAIHLYILHRRQRRHREEADQVEAVQRARLTASAARGERRIELLKGSGPSGGQ